MAQEYEVRPDGNGGWTIGPKTMGCGGVIAVVVFFIILALIIKACDSDYSTNDDYADPNDVSISSGVEGEENYYVGGESTEGKTTVEEPDELLLFDLPAYYILEDSYAVAPIIPSENLETRFDVDGWKHEKYNQILCDNNGKISEGTTNYVRYELNGKYSRITGSLFATHKTNVCWLEFYDENNRHLGSSSVINSENTSCSVDIDVSGVNYLTVYLCAADTSYSAHRWIFSELVISK